MPNARIFAAENVDDYYLHRPEQFRRRRRRGGAGRSRRRTRAQASARHHDTHPRSRGGTGQFMDALRQLPFNTTSFLSHLPGQRIPFAACRWPTKRTWSPTSAATPGSRTSRSGWGAGSTTSATVPGGWQLDTSSGQIRSPVIVLATGNYRTHHPRHGRVSSFRGQFLHSSDFTNAWPYRGRNVLIVGAGNSAADIAPELADNAAGRIWLAARTPPHRAVGDSTISIGIFSSNFPRGCRT